MAWNARLPELEIDVTPLDGTVVVRVRGEVDLASAHRVEGAVRALLDERQAPALVVLDLADVSFIDVSGLSVLTHTHDRAKARGTEVVIGPHSSQVRSVLNLTGPAATIPVEDLTLS